MMAHWRGACPASDDVCGGACSSLSWLLSKLKRQPNRCLVHASLLEPLSEAVEPSNLATVHVGASWAQLHVALGAGFRPASSVLISAYPALSCQLWCCN